MNPLTLRSIVIVVAGPFFALWFGHALFEIAQGGALRPGELVEKHAAGEPPSAINETTARISWLGMAALYIPVEIAVGLFAVGVVRRIGTPGMRRFIGIGFGILGVSYLVLLWWNRPSPDRPPRGIFQVFDFTWRVVSGRPETYAPEFLTSARLVIDALNVLAAVSLVCCWAGATSLLTPVLGTNQDRARSLATRLATLKELLFAASLLLGMGIIHMSVWLRWGTYFIPDPEAAGTAKDLVGSITGYWGGIFSAMAALLFTPVYLSLKKQSTEMLENDTLDEQSHAMLKNAVEVRVVDWIVRITTIAAPAVIGQSGELLIGLAQ